MKRVPYSSREVPPLGLRSAASPHFHGGIEIWQSALQSVMPAGNAPGTEIPIDVHFNVLPLAGMTIHLVQIAAEEELIARALL